MVTNRASLPIPESVQERMTFATNIRVLGVVLTLAVRSSWELPRGPGSNPRGREAFNKPPFVNINLGGEYNDIVTSYKVWISCRIFYIFALLRSLFLFYFSYFFALLPVMQRHGHSLLHVVEEAGMGEDNFV